MDPATWWRAMLAPSDEILPTPPTHAEQEAALHAAWQRASAAFFNGSLPQRAIRLVPLPPRARLRVHGEAVEIAACLARDWRAALGTLLHAAVRVRVGIENNCYGWTGPAFCAEANRVGAMIDAIHVSPRARHHHLPRRWPEIAAHGRDTISALSALHDEVSALRRDLESARLAEVALHRVCTVITDAAQRAIRRVRRMHVRSGGQAATMRAVARVLDDLRASLDRPALPTSAREILNRPHRNCVAFRG